jgi:hypothetical protein
MKLPEASIREYKKIYAEEFGREISDSEAEKQARNLLNIFSIIAKNARNK